MLFGANQSLRMVAYAVALSGGAAAALSACAAPSRPALAEHTAQGNTQLADDPGVPVAEDAAAWETIQQVMCECRLETSADPVDTSGVSLAAAAEDCRTKSMQLSHGRLRNQLDGIGIWHLGSKHWARGCQLRRSASG